jgi:hypothetical protein
MYSTEEVPENPFLKCWNSASLCKLEIESQEMKPLLCQYLNYHLVKVSTYGEPGDIAFFGDKLHLLIVSSILLFIDYHHSSHTRS